MTTLEYILSGLLVFFSAADKLDKGFGIAPPRPLVLAQSAGSTRSGHGLSATATR